MGEERRGENRRPLGRRGRGRRKEQRGKERRGQDTEKRGKRGRVKARRAGKDTVCKCLNSGQNRGTGKVNEQEGMNAGRRMQ